MSYTPPTALKSADLLDQAIRFECSLIIPPMGTSQLCLVCAGQRVWGISPHQSSGLVVGVRFSMTCATTCALVDLSIDLTYMPVWSCGNDNDDKLTKKFPTMREGDQRSPSGLHTLREPLCFYAEICEKITRPAFDAAFLDAEDKDGAAFDHTSTFGVVEAACDAGNDALPRSMDEAESIDSGLNVADDWWYVWVARHLRTSKFEVVRQLRGCGMVSYGEAEAPSFMIRLRRSLLHKSRLICIRIDE